MSLENINMKTETALKISCYFYFFTTTIVNFQDEIQPKLFLSTDISMQSRASARKKKARAMTKDKPWLETEKHKKITELETQMQSIIVTAVYLLFAVWCTMSTPLRTEAAFIRRHETED